MVFFVIIKITNSDILGSKQEHSTIIVNKKTHQRLMINKNKLIS